MDLKVNGFNQSFGIKMKPSISKFEAAADISVKDRLTGIVYNVLPKKPEYMYASEKKIIQYPVMVNGVESFYNVKYPYAQNQINRVGFEMTQKEGLDLQLMSAREIYKDITQKAMRSESAEVKTLAVG